MTADTVTTGSATSAPPTPTASHRGRPTAGRPTTPDAVGVPLPRYEALAIGLGCGRITARRS